MMQPSDCVIAALVIRKETDFRTTSGLQHSIKLVDQTIES